MNKKKKNKKMSKTATFLFIALVCLLTVISFTKKFNLLGNMDGAGTTAPAPNAPASPTNKIDYGPAKPGDIVVSPEKNNSSVDEPPKPTANTPISVLITRANRTSVGVYIEKIPDGSCTLSVTQNGSEKISINSKVISQKDYSTCEGFEIDSTKLNSSAFTVKVSVSSSSRTGSAAQEVN